ncbi:MULTISPECIES: hypothetical protein [Microbacterium]|nr:MULTISPECIES: hypothetical protein [Microbacterium]MDQ1085165.1 hypothetical protein [Microbacterium sp. SORGH_AS_0344]MDQ1169529.1 hypothetical protein [Microbacterium proteolyticum]
MKRLSTHLRRPRLLRAASAAGEVVALAAAPLDGTPATTEAPTCGR